MKTRNRQAARASRMPRSSGMSMMGGGRNKGLMMGAAPVLAGLVMRQMKRRRSM